MPTAPTKIDLAERFHTKYVVQPDGCWRWTDVPAANGYGYFGLGSRAAGKVLAHRYSYELLVGPIPDRLTLDHLCHGRDLTCPGGRFCLHRLCVNPQHLRPIPRVENIGKDRWRRVQFGQFAEQASRRIRDPRGRFQRGC